MPNKVTIADIAKSLGLSRNTVSKALNGGRGITEETRQRVLCQAAAMNYKMLGTVQNRAETSVRRNILVVCRDNQLTESFFGQLILDLQQLVRAREAVMTLQFMSPEEVAEGVLPENLSSADGVIGLEILDKNYMSLLIRQGRPCVFFDGDRRAGEIGEPFDLVLEDEYALYRLVCELTGGGVRRLGFAGDPEHCWGFWNRYCCFTLALQQHGLSDGYSLLFREGEDRDFTAMFERRLKGKPLPEAFICVNSYVAECLLRALEHLAVEVPGQVRVAAFGGGFERRHAGPASDDGRKNIASALVMLLFDRMAHPDAASRRVMTPSSIEWAAEENIDQEPNREGM